MHGEGSNPSSRQKLVRWHSPAPFKFIVTLVVIVVVIAFLVVVVVAVVISFSVLVAEDLRPVGDVDGHRRRGGGGGGRGFFLGGAAAVERSAELERVSPARVVNLGLVEFERGFGIHG